MKWTTEKPTEPGIYWFRFSPDNPTLIVCLTSDKAQVFCFKGEEVNGLGTEDTQEWAGPIPEPEEV